MKLVLALLIPFSAFGQMYSFKFKAKNQSERSKIAKYFHIDQVIESDVYSTGSGHELNLAQKHLGGLLTKVDILGSHSLHARSNEIQYPSGDEKFHTYLEMVKTMKKIATDHPEIAVYRSLGKTVLGRDIPHLIIGPKNASPMLPSVAFFGGHHAREHLSVEVPLLSVKKIVENKNEPEIRKLISSRVMHFIPMVNPDGAMHDIKGRKYKYWRKNRAMINGKRRGVDLNRNYSYGWGGPGSSGNSSSQIYRGPSAFSEPETQAMRRFFESYPGIRAAVSFHTYSELVLYPWGHIVEGVGGDDEKIMKAMANKMASYNGYRPMQASALYVASGDTCDWAYSEFNIYCFTFELSPKSSWGGGFYPGAKMIDRAFKANWPAVLYLSEKVGDTRSVIKRSF